MHKAHGGWVELEETMDRFRLQSRRLCQAFGGTSCGCTEEHAHLFGLENLEDTRDDRRLPNPWTTRDHGDFAVQGHGDRLPLGRRECPTRFLLHPGKSTRWINVAPGCV